MPPSQDEAAARLAGLVDSAMDAIITVDEQQRIVLYNRAAERIFGWPASQVLGDTLEKLLPQRFRGGHAGHMRKFGATGVTTRRMGDNTIIRGLRANGEEFPMEASISQLPTEQGKLFTVILRDVSERVKAQEELASFATEASAIREQEMGRIARELHDELAQSLTALKMDTIWLRDNLKGDPAAAAAKLEAMLQMLDGSVAATRRIASDLRPLLLDDLGLVPALEWLADSFTKRTGVPCEMDLDEDFELGEPYASAVFRIVQESLTNVGKHARASRVRVSLGTEMGVLVVRVRDNGVGFDPTLPRKPHSLGLAGLKERSRLLKGSVQVISAPGEGTSVETRVPMEHLGVAR